MKVNKKTPVVRERLAGGLGTAVYPIGNYQTLQRLVLACMLWEDQFYVDGKTSAALIKEYVHKSEPQQVADLAIKARSDMKLRHVPLLLVRELARHPGLKYAEKDLVSNTLFEVIQRPDEITEFVAIYWKDGKQPLSKQVKIGLNRAFSKFTEYSFAKFQGSGDVKLRDVMFLVHAKPANTEAKWTKEDRKRSDKPLNASETLYKKIVDQNLATPDTWEVALSGGGDKKETFTRLMQDKKLGALAFLRNLRNMKDAGIPTSVLREYASTINTEKVLPFRFIAAKKYAPDLSDVLESLMFKCLEGAPKLKGRTVLVIDVSGSMGATVSAKSEMTRLDAAKALTMLAREVCEEVVIYCTAGSDYKRLHKTSKVSPYRGFALQDEISKQAGALGGGGIFTVQCMDYIADKEINETVDRVIIFTDEQDTAYRGDPASAKLIGKYNYIFNVGAYKNGINSNKWNTITGFSESMIDYVIASENIDNNQ